MDKGCKKFFGAVSKTEVESRYKDNESDTEEESLVTLMRDKFMIRTNSPPLNCFSLKSCWYL